MVSNKKKIFLISTEPSGDLLGYDLIKQIYKSFKNIEIIGVGGEKMNELKFKSFLPTDGMNVNGIVEVLFKLKKFIKYLNKVKQLIIQTKPDLVITIDSPSFNYRIVKKLQFLRPKTKFVHLVAPTVWAWKKYRAKGFALITKYLKPDTEVDLLLLKEKSGSAYVCFNVKNEKIKKVLGIETL